MSAVTRPHIVVLGTGITALTLARSLLLTTPPLPIHLTLIDKARNPGGRLTTRYYDSGVVLETGARVFESPRSDPAFAREVEGWEQKGWVKEVKQKRRKGVMGDGKWWEGSGGLTKGLVEGLLGEVKAASAGRLDIHYEVTAANPTPTTLGDEPLALTLTPSLDLPPVSLLVHTAPSPQVAALLPAASSTSPTPYLKTFALLLPTITAPDLPVYHRDPHPSLNSIATGLTSTTSNTPAGLVVQSTPEKLGLGYTKDESSDEVVREAFFRVLREGKFLPTEVLDEAAKLTGRESQVKRWKFAQVEAATGEPGSTTYAEDPVQVLEGGKVILAGDGTAGGAGGIVGAWRAGERAAEVVRQWLDREGVAGLK